MAMDLREYIQLVRRRWRVIGGVGLVAMLVAIYLALRGATVYQAVIRIALSISPQEGAAQFYNYDGYYPWLTSEYLSDDLSEVLKSRAFAEDVLARYQAATGEVVKLSDIRDFMDIIRVRKTHRLLTITIASGDQRKAEDLGQAITAVLSEGMERYFGQLGQMNAQVRVIDPARVERTTNTAGIIMDIVQRTVIGLLVGVGLALLLDYLDGSVRSTREVEQLLGVTVLGEIPAEPKAV